MRVRLSTLIPILLLLGVSCAPARSALGERELGTSGTTHTDTADARSHPPEGALVAADTSLTTEYVRAVLRREFSGLVELDSVQMRPAYLVGDFDGDGKRDLVVIGRLGTSTAVGGRPPGLRAYVPLGTGMEVRQSDSRYPAARLHRRRGDVVQAVIHGFREPSGARRRDNVIVLLAVRSETVLRRFRGPLNLTVAGDEPEPIPPPKLLGDAILLLYDDGTGSALYWDGERYRWYPYEPTPR